MRAALFLVFVCASLVPWPAGAAQDKSGPGMVIFQHPDGKCGMSYAVPEAMEVIQKHGAKVISPVYPTGTKMMDKLRALKASGVCKS